VAAGFLEEFAQEVIHAGRPAIIRIRKKRFIASIYNSFRRDATDFCFDAFLFYPSCEKGLEKRSLLLAGDDTRFDF